MIEKQETKQEVISKDVKEVKDTKEIKKEKSNAFDDVELIVAYSQLAILTLQNSGSELTPKSIREEIKMFHKRFNTKEIKRLVNILVKEKK